MCFLYVSLVTSVVDILNIRSLGGSPGFLETPNQVYGAIDNFLCSEGLGRERREEMEFVFQPSLTVYALF